MYFAKNIRMKRKFGAMKLKKIGQCGHDNESISEISTDIEYKYIRVQRYKRKYCK